MYLFISNMLAHYQVNILLHFIVYIKDLFLTFYIKKFSNSKITILEKKYINTRSIFITFQNYEFRLII